MLTMKLAQILLQYPDLDVLVDGYEAGYEDLRTVAIGKVVENYYVEDYYGPYNSFGKPEISVMIRQPRKPSS
jgi:hypothetical protein